MLNAIVRAHVQTIPFENLDVLLGRPIELEPSALERKLIHDRCGGYCLEQNSLLLCVLTDVGFDAHPLSARVDAVSLRGARLVFVLAIATAFPRGSR